MIQRIPVTVTARSPLIDHTDFHLTDGCRTYTREGFTYHFSFFYLMNGIHELNYPRNEGIRTIWIDG